MDGFDPNAFLAQAEAGGQPPSAVDSLVSPLPALPEASSPTPSFEGFDPEAFLKEAQADKYGTPGQQAIAGLEGLAHGVAGPLATLAEKHVLGVPEEDILGRQEENPFTYGAGQGVGLVGGMLTGVGEGALMAKAGLKAAEAVGLGAKALEGASLGYKVGHSAVSQAAEMAVLSGSDEVSKMILNDPDTSAESALANIGLGMALGGAGGAFMTGAVSPLWNATAGPQVEKLLGGLKGHINGRPMLPEHLEMAANDLGIQIDPILKGPMAGRGQETFSKLRYAQHPEVQLALEKLEKDVSEGVMNSMGIPLEEAQVYSKNLQGKSLESAVEKEIKTRYEPFEERYRVANEQSAKFSISDESRLSQFGKLQEQAMEKVGTDSPAYKLYSDWGNRMLAKEDVKGLDMLRSELGNDIQKAMRAADYNTADALKDIRSSFMDFRESTIMKEAANLEKSGVKGAMDEAKGILNENAQLARDYREFAKMHEELADHLGVGHFKGANSLIQKIKAAGPESLVNKFSPKGNADIIPFLQKYFPDTLQHLQKSELLDMIKPAISSAKGESPINVERLNKILRDKMAGKQELVDFAIPKETLQKLQSAESIMNSIPKHKDSGTAGGMMKLLTDVPRSALAAVAMFAGHNPVTGAIAGEMASKLGKDMPEAVRLAYLKYLGSDQPIKAEGFKAMVDFFHNTYKGETMLAKSTKAVLQRGTQVLTESQLPNKADRDKLDKIVTKMQDNPEALTKAFNGQTGHYLPNHQQALATATTRAVDYLQGLKPQPHVLGPLDKPVPPTPIEEARYARALDIATTPSIVLQHVKDGTLQMSDIKDLNGMFPGLYKSMVQKLSNEMNSQHADEEPIPYRTRVGMALFMGSPVDATMTPQAMQAAQPVPQQPQGGMAQGQGKSLKSLGKNVKQSMTPGQAAESAKANRD